MWAYRRSITSGGEWGKILQVDAGHRTSSEGNVPLDPRGTLSERNEVRGGREPWGQPSSCRTTSVRVRHAGLHSSSCRAPSADIDDTATARQLALLSCLVAKRILMEPDPVAGETLLSIFNTQ